jgi:hypothetical protein
MKCKHAEGCNSEVCKHKTDHPRNEFCGGTCRWAGDEECCIPESDTEKLSMVLGVMLAYVGKDDAKMITAQVGRIFGVKEEAA